jgi:mRNA interferase MazF
VEVKRGDIVVVAAKGAYSGKPRPAVIVQSDLLNPTHPSVLIALVTSELRELPGFRIAVAPSGDNGLSVPSEIMADKLLAVPRESIGRRIGQLDGATQVKLDRALVVVLGLA